MTELEIVENEDARSAYIHTLVHNWSHQIPT